MAELGRIVDAQSAPHRDLVDVVRKHFASDWQRPIADHTLAAFEDIRPWLLDAGQLIVDSCCGTGESTRQLALGSPDASVVGIDKSRARLKKHEHDGPRNYRLVRADVNDFWRLLVRETVPITRHCLFYPNPYPKASQLRKRWYASPAFPSLVSMGGELEVRSNWSIYVEEFATALDIAGVASEVSTVSETAEAVSLFEKKYRERGQTLYRLTADLTPLP